VRPSTERRKQRALTRGRKMIEQENETEPGASANQES
jgi:hypothetical protein